MKRTTRGAVLNVVAGRHSRTSRTFNAEQNRVHNERMQAVHLDTKFSQHVSLRTHHVSNASYPSENLLSRSVLLEILSATLEVTLNAFVREGPD